MTVASSRDASPNRCQLRFSRTSFMAASSLSVVVIIVPCAQRAAGSRAAGGLACLARRVVTGLVLVRLPRGELDPAPVAVPPGTIARRHVVVARTQADRAVDELADDVGLPGVPVGLGDHMDQDFVQRHLAA